MPSKRNFPARSLLKRVVAYTLLLAGLWFVAPGMFERQFIYFPTSDQADTPADFGLAFEKVRFAAADGTPLDGWLVPGDKDAPLVLFCMGNYGNMSHRAGNLALLHRLGVNLFIFDYRGYGLNQGRPTEEGTYQDIRGAVTWLRQQGWPPQRLIFFGRSLGAAVVLQAAIETPPAGVILETPFTSISAMGRTHYPLLHRLLGWLVEARYDNLAKISRLKSPLLIFHGDHDSICPPKMARQLYDGAPQPKQLIWLPGADHNSTVERGGPDYWAAWREFIKQYTGYRGP